MGAILFWFTMGIGILLLGVYLLRSGLMALSHSRLERFLRQATHTPWKGFIWGALATALVQSSTATTVLTVGMVDSKAISFYQGLSLILGANVGTCLTVQLLAFDLQALAWPAIILGTLFLIPRPSRAVGLSLWGCGLIFYALSLMSSASTPLRDSAVLPGFLTAASNSPWQALLVGTAFTALLHSSSAMTGIAMVLTAQGVVPLPGALSIVLGANIGTCSTALVAALFSSRAAQRTALANLLINVAGALIVLPFLYTVAPLLSLASPNPARQVAHFHTLFNLLSSLVALGLLKPLSAFLTWLVPD
ncbi:phosphate:Na+ symporter [Thermanaeromonas toyohensis ToBE]|uniref:Phosphate:Na+ symporter n=2 Tax=Thermanaeromonas TaxID=202949 RepID=A0A1W1VMI5_9FIRM|nr:phosphate:Na+ symporter [Thermanaeromonas toyohensis ToBE]